MAVTRDGDNGLREDARLPSSAQNANEAYRGDRTRRRRRTHRQRISAARVRRRSGSFVLCRNGPSSEEREDLGGDTKGIKDRTAGGERDFCLVSSAEDTSQTGASQECVEYETTTTLNTEITTRFGYLLPSTPPQIGTLCRSGSKMTEFHRWNSFNVKTQLRLETRKAECMFV